MIANAAMYSQIGERLTRPSRTGLRGLVLRPYARSDRSQITDLLRFLPLLYPDADTWLQRRLADVEGGIARCTVGTLPGGCAPIGLTIETPKSAKSLKLSTVYVREQYRGNGVGAALLRHAHRQWIAARLEAVHVTVDSERRHLLEPLLRSNGFDLTAVERDRYAVGRDELVFHWNHASRQGRRGALHLPPH